MENLQVARRPVHVMTWRHVAPCSQAAQIRFSVVENPVSGRFGTNLRALRGAMGQRDLADRVAALGVPMRLNTISRIENGLRDADVPELLALAVALGVSPLRLLLTDAADDTEIALTPSFGVEAAGAWQWASGERPLPGDESDREEFRRRNKPHAGAASQQLQAAEIRFAQHEQLLERLQRGETRLAGSRIDLWLASVRGILRLTGLVPPPLSSELGYIDSLTQPEPPPELGPRFGDEP